MNVPPNRFMRAIFLFVFITQHRLDSLRFYERSHHLLFPASNIPPLRLSFHVFLHSFS